MPVSQFRKFLRQFNSTIVIAKKSFDEFKTNFRIHPWLAHLLKLIEQMFNFDFMQPIRLIENQQVVFLSVF